MALGYDGTVIICTHSGHVFVRQRIKLGTGQLKFKRIPYLQRVIGVACNESGAFAAIRVDAKPSPIPLKGRTVEEDMALLLPHIRRFESQMTSEDFDRERKGIKVGEDDEDEGTNSVTRDIATASRLCTILRRWRSDDNDTLFSWSEPLLGSDVHLQVGDVAIPAHQVVLKLRVPRLRRVLEQGGSVAQLKLASSTAQSTTIAVTACHPLLILLLLHYIYTDDIPAVWDSRVARALTAAFPDLDLRIGDIKSDLLDLATTLDLSPLIAVLASTAKVSIPIKTLSVDLQSFFTRTSPVASRDPDCDVTLVLADRDVACSSVILRARCPFFEAMYEDGEWTTARQEDDKGGIVITMDHLKWRPMKLVFKYIHQGLEDDLFDYLRKSASGQFLLGLMVCRSRDVGRVLGLCF